MTARKNTKPPRKPRAGGQKKTPAKSAPAPRTMTYKMKRSQCVPLIDTLLEKHGNYLQIIAAEEGIVPQSSRIVVTINIVGQEIQKEGK